ncbi:M64 family metallopeptidase [Arthrobacter sp. H20]|uniref:M64 family metallopeptidase n=1 Tax=Arthrobacter sp. H20 TaxID=1267981 RepID=UPI00047C253F|nr:M64 family metallopeptidase [Arthrobacter sp. H20]
MTTADGAIIGTTQIRGSAPRNRAFNVVLLGDGFRAAEQAAFDAACLALANAFLGAPPFNDLAPAINIFRVNVSSTDSGADDPASAGGTGATARTYFDATFGGNGIRPLLLCNAGTALSVAATQVPEFTTVLVIVNSTVYGGSGGSIGTYSLADSATEIGIHEMGHTAFGPADEYQYYAGGGETGHDHHPGPEPAEPNVTITRTGASLKWRWAVNAATTIPTMTNPDCSTVDSRPSPVAAGTVGTFEGAHYYRCGALRPEFACKMGKSGVPFCRICRQVIWNQIGPMGALTARAKMPITVVDRYPEHLDVFTVGSDGRTMSNWWDQSSSWAGWFHLMDGFASPGGAGSPVTAVARYAGHLDLFTVGTDNRVYSAWWSSSGGGSNWFQLGTLVARAGSTVNVLARYADHLDVFTTASDGRIMSIWWDVRTGWSTWFQISGGVAANGATATAIWNCWWDERSGWSRWFQVGGQLARPDATVNVVARHPDHLDLFTTAPDGKIVSTWWSARTGWGNWFQVSGGVASAGSPVTAVARYSNHLDLFTVGTDNRIYSTWWHDASGWAGWFNISGGIARPGSQVAAVSRVTEHLDVLVVGSHSVVYSTWWNASTGWAGWFQVGIT